MDPTEDLSARVLLKHILSTEPPQTPITRRYVSSYSLDREGGKSVIKPAHIKIET